LKLQRKLFKLTKPDNISFSDKDQGWLKQIIALYKEIEDLHKPIDDTPKTVGEYYQKNIKDGTPS
jgi:pantothenate synthetase